MIMILNLGIGLITPPVGPTLFVGCAIGKVTMEQVIAGSCGRSTARMCLALLLVTYIPAISLWLPGLIEMSLAARADRRRHGRAVHAERALPRSGDRGARRRRS